MDWVDSLVRSAIVKDASAGLKYFSHVDDIVKWIKGVNEPFNSSVQRAANTLNIPTNTIRREILLYLDSLLFDDKNDSLKVLGFNVKPDEKVIKQRYRMLVSIYHPDKNIFDDLGVDCTIRTEVLNASYKALLSGDTAFIKPTKPSKTTRSRRAGETNRAKKQSGNNKSTSKNSRKKFNQIDERYFHVDRIKNKVVSFSLAVAGIVFLLLGLVAFSAYSDFRNKDVAPVAISEKKSESSIEEYSIITKSSSIEPQDYVQDTDVSIFNGYEVEDKELGLLGTKFDGQSGMVSYAEEFSIIVDFQGLAEKPNLNKTDKR